MNQNGKKQQNFLNLRAMFIKAIGLDEIDFVMQVYLSLFVLATHYLLFLILLSYICKA